MEMLSKEDWTRELMPSLYEEGYIQTLWHARDPQKRREGWILKDKTWSPWFFNIRQIGDSPALFYKVCRAMAGLISEHKDIDLFIAVEMAGIPLVGGLAIASALANGMTIRFGYTRPLPRKVRKPMEALDLLREMDFDVAGYGEKEFVEARINDGDRIAILDDMATGLGSKKIARLITLWDVERRGVEVSCDKILYFLNRGKDNRQKGMDFASEPEKGLHPAKLTVDYVVEFDDALPLLEGVMGPEEYALINSFQKNPGRFQDEKVKQEVLAMAAKTR